ncbi:hypothetical protein [Nonomuraea indica]|nr:hypothetical protein [Nonomuraea indica]
MGKVTADAVVPIERDLPERRPVRQGVTTVGPGDGGGPCRQRGR